MPANKGTWRLWSNGLVEQANVVDWMLLLEELAYPPQNRGLRQRRHRLEAQLLSVGWAYIES